MCQVLRGAYAPFSASLRSCADHSQNGNHRYDIANDADDLDVSTSVGQRRNRGVGIEGQGPSTTRKE